MLETLCTLKIEKVEKIHPYEITSPKPGAKDKRWQTYVYDENYYNNRRKIHGYTKKEIYQELYKIYFENETAQTLETYFPLGLDFREKRNKSPLTLRRNANHWNKNILLFILMIQKSLLYSFSSY